MCIRDRVITIRFTLAEVPPAGFPVVKLGSQTLSECEPFGFDYVCTYALQDTDTDGSKTLLIRTKDEAGNEFEDASLALSYDFTPPSFSATPSASAYPRGAVVRYTISASEPVETPQLTPSPAITLSSSDAAPAL